MTWVVLMLAAWGALFFLLGLALGRAAKVGDEQDER